MLRLFAPEVVSFFEMSEGNLTFLSTRAKTVGSKLTVRIRLVDHEAPHVDVPVTVLTSRTSSMGKGYRVSASLALSPLHMEQLEDLLYSFARRPDLGKVGRRSVRQAVCMKTRSPQLPGQHGLTVDMSSHGLRLRCSGPVDVGMPVELELQTDMGGLPNITLKGRVLSCAASSDGLGYELGIDMVGSTPAQVAIVGYYLQTLAGRSQPGQLLAV